MADPKLSTGRKMLFWSIILAGLPFLTLVVIEGASSLLLLGRDVSAARGLPELRHTEYDTLLGWIHRPHLHLNEAGNRWVAGELLERLDGLGE